MIVWLVFVVKITYARKGTFLISETLYPILRVVIVALIIILLIVVGMKYVTSGQNEIVDMFSKLFQW
jgi:hypothetical protein